MSQSTDLARAQQRFARRQRLVRWKGWLPWAIGGIVALLAGLTVWIFYFSSVLAVTGVRVRVDARCSGDMYG